MAPGPEIVKACQRHTIPPAHRRAAATLIGAALLQGLIEPERIKAALGGDDGGVGAVYTEAVGALGRWMGSVSEALEGPVPSFQEHNIGVSLAGDDADESLIIFEWWNFNSVAITLRGVPPLLARSVYQSVHLLWSLGLGVTIDDMRWRNMGMDVSLTLIEALHKRALLDDAEASWAWFCSKEGQDIGGAIVEFWSLETLADWNEWLHTWAPLPGEHEQAWRIPHPDEDRCGPNPSPREVAEALLRRIWDWRQADPALYRHPLARWVRGVAQDVRLCQRAKIGDRLTDASDQVNGEPIESAYLVCFGDPWDTLLAEDLVDQLNAAGEPFVRAWSCSGALEPKGLRDYLYFFARAHGWCHRGERICARSG